MEDARLIGGRRLLAIACTAEAATGLALLLVPRLVVDLLFGAAVVGPGVVVSRLAGISLIALALACWPGDRRSGSLAGMLAYSGPVTLYLLYIGLAGTSTGTLLWPAAVVHLILTILLAGAWALTTRAASARDRRPRARP